MSLLLHLFFNFLTPAEATSFYIKPFPEFTRTTSNIVRGRLNNVHVANALTADGNKAIYTYANLEIKEVLKGSITKSNITIKKSGGTIDGYTIEVPSSAEFKDGEETVLYLEKEADDQTYEVTGLELGKFALEEKQGELFLEGGALNYPESNWNAPSADPEHTHTPNSQKKAWSLKALRDLLKSQTVNQAVNQAVIENPNLPPQYLAKPKTHPVTKSQGSVNANSEFVSGTLDEEKSEEFRYYPHLALGILLMAGAFYFLKRK